jgi:hypothetical protein
MWSLFTSICQIPDFYLTPTNPMQPLFSTWYNPEKRCDVMVESSTISIEQKRVWKLWARDKWSLRMRVSLAILSPEHLQNDMWSKVLGETQILPEKLIQEWWWTVNHIVMGFCILFWDHISSLNETCLSFVFMLFWNQEMLLSKGIFTKYFDQAPTCD